MSDINQLIPDIYSAVQRQGGWFNPEIAREMGDVVGLRVRDHFDERPAEKPSLRLSRLGPQCPKALWLSVNAPGKKEPLPSWAVIKLAYGHLVEALAIALAKGAGHEVTGEQDELVVDDIPGHRDCVIDGYVVDVKSVTTYGYQDFKDRNTDKIDSWGYLDQLDGYILGSRDDPLVRFKDRGFIFAVDKTLGHMVLYEHKLRTEHILSRISQYKEIVNQVNPPRCTCKTISRGENGNLQLDVKASYSPFKHSCFPELRTCLYASGPVYFTKVVEWPKHHGRPLPEVDKHGNYVP